jgi:signal transduction histidine kinase
MPIKDLFIIVSPMFALLVVGVSVWLTDGLLAMVLVALAIAQTAVALAFARRYRNELVVVRKLLDEQEASAKMLVRRDLELSRANEELRSLDDAKTNFISIVGHQLRTPLSGMKWSMSMILGGEFGPLGDEQKTFLLKTYESNNRMIALVNDMLNADWIESGRATYAFAPTNIADLVDNVLFEIVPLMKQRQLKLSVERNPGIPEVHVDAEKMRAVIQNLLENATKYTPNGGSIEVSLAKEPGRIVFRVKDSGIGIPEAERKNLFNRFFRARNAIKTETDGTGLGLFICKRIIERHGGAIWFESEEGKGSAFYFSLPLAA